VTTAAEQLGFPLAGPGKAPAAERISNIKASIGFYSDRGPRECNEDFAGAVFGAELPRPRREIVAAIADGIGGAKGGRVAAELAVRGFLDGFCDQPESAEVRHSAAQVLDALNRWICSQGHQDPRLAGMGCTFTALVLRGRTAHVVHVGDTRAYRLRNDRLSCLTSDHVRQGVRPGSCVLVRALGVEPELRLDYAAQPVTTHDRFLLCSDGVHGFLTDERMSEILRERSGSGDAARALVSAACQSGSTDNCTALVLDIIGLPTSEWPEAVAGTAQLPIVPLPVTGETIDGFVLKAVVSEGRYTRLFSALDELEGGEVVVKFPKPQLASADVYRAAFLREAWVGASVNSPWLGHTIELPAGRQTCLYTVMPLYRGELLETRLAHGPLLGLEESRTIGIRLARAAAALHRAGIIHRDIKPDNVILEDNGSLKLIDLGAVRVPALEDSPPADIPGTTAYMAPEMFAGEPGNPGTDIYALGVTLFRAVTGEYPYGNPDATAGPRRERPRELSLVRPDLPAWVQGAIGRAIATDPGERYRDMGEFAAELESGPAGTPISARRPRTLYERSPLRFWQAVAALLAAGLLLSLIWR
jgi:serine/threonine protein phosphatase PrpC